MILSVRQGIGLRKPVDTPGRFGQVH
jgi:hypothetical protein